MKIIIIGGGTSGLIAAAMMQNYWKDKVNISLIYDPNNRNIGVGEGTTPNFIDTLNNNLGFDSDYILNGIDATIKLGVLFKDWIPNQEYYHGFGQVVCDETNTQNDSLTDNRSSLYSLLNNCYDGGVNWNHPTTTIPENFGHYNGYHYAYHFTTDKLSDFLFDALKNKIHIIEDEITRVTSDGKNIQSVTGKNTGNYHADLWIDASGFDAILHKTLNPEWVDLSKWLPIDRAIPQPVANDTNHIPTYTLAQATKNGWIWKIPTRERFGTGYLYSSKFTTDDEARLDYNNWLLHNHNVELSTNRVIKWNTGYYKQAWIGNCFAVGLAGGFVEPLEALTHQYLTYMIENFCNINSTLTNVDYNRDRLNESQSKIFNNYVQFLNLHYCTNRNDSSFWRHMTSNKLKWVETIENKCKVEFIDLFRFDEMLDHWGHDNYIQVMNGLNMFNNDAIKNYGDSINNSEYYYNDAKEQHLYLQGYKNNIKMVDHKQFLETLKEVSILPYI